MCDEIKDSHRGEDVLGRPHGASLIASEEA